MDAIDNIKSFAREFINGNGRTPDRKRLIVETYFKMFGERTRSRCSTCLIEAIFRIIKYNPMEKKQNLYRLRKGVILQPFGDGIITNDHPELDRFAEQELRLGRANPGMFAVMPETPEQPAELEIVPPEAGDEPVVDIPADKIDTESVPAMVEKPKPNRPKSYKKRKK